MANPLIANATTSNVVENVLVTAGLVDVTLNRNPVPVGMPVGNVTVLDVSVEAVTEPNELVYVPAVLLTSMVN